MWLIYLNQNIWEDSRENLSLVEQLIYRDLKHVTPYPGKYVCMLLNCFHNNVAVTTSALIIFRDISLNWMKLFWVYWAEVSMTLLRVDGRHTKCRTVTSESKGLHQGQQKHSKLRSWLWLNLGQSFHPKSQLSCPVLKQNIIFR